MRRSLQHLVALLLVVQAGNALAAFSSVSRQLKQPDEWYKSDEARKIAEIVLSYQSPLGDWPKNIDTATSPYTGKPEDLKGTFDNGATLPELRFLARMATVTKEERYAKSFLKGLDHVLKAQYDNGGWPQYYPAPEKGYWRHITFNDGAMTHLMDFVHDVSKDEKAFPFVDPALRRKCAAAWDKGLDCILNCQIKANGQPTVWCAQHDEKTLAPANARAFELASYSGGESADLVLLLMTIDNPSDRAKQAIQGAATWYARNRLTGIRTEHRPDKDGPKGFDVIVVQDAKAPPTWARFYDLETGKPFFCGRDGVKKWTLAEIEIERRAGYAWYGNSGQKVLDAYPKWAAKHSMPVDLKQ
jgi:PelA/Pel-15E family pectate lyase